MSTSQDPKEPTDDTWVRALKRREAWAWERLHRLALDRVFAYLFVRVGRREDAEDLAVEVFTAAYASIDRFRGEAAITTWLIAIARGKILDTMRYRRRHPELLEVEMTLLEGSGDGELDPENRVLSLRPLTDGSEPAAQSPEALVEQRETMARVQRLVLRLPEGQREALWLRCVDELSLAEIAGVLGRSEDAVKGLLHRAKTTVLRQLHAEETPRLPARRFREVTHAKPF